MRWLTLALCLGLIAGSAAAIPPDEGYESENAHKGVRPAKPLLSFQDKKDDKKKDDDKSISDDEVEKLKKMDGKEVTVSGKVHEVFINKGKTAAMLNFGSDFKKCFKAVIYASNWSKWDKGVDDIKALQGK